MSFYGTVFYEFERLFFKFKFKNASDNEDTVDLRGIDSVDGITATERWDTFHIDTGNRWIKLASMDEGGERKGVTLFHAMPGPKKYEQSAMELIELEEDETPDVRLGIHQAFKVPSIVYDNAGHIVSADTTTYQLPDPSEMVLNGMEKHFEEDVSPQGFEHEYEEFPEEDEAYTVLEPGQPVVVNKLLISDKGIVTGIEPVFYKMPASDAEQDFNELKERMEEVESILEEVPETYAKLEDTGVIKDLYYPDDETGVDEMDRFVTLTEALGNLEKSKVTITGDLRKSVSIADQLTAIYELASGINQALGNRISTLDARVKELEDQLKAAQE